MSNIVRIPSKLYHQLDLKGGQKLIAFYCILKHFNRTQKLYAYKAKNNKTVKGKSILRNRCNLAVSAIDKFLPMLVEMELCEFDRKGNFILLGNQKTKELYDCEKMVPILIGANLIKTQYNCLSVKLHSEERQQKREIEKKHNRSDLQRHEKNPKSKRLYNLAIRSIKKYGRDLKINYKTVLSNQAYAVLKDGTRDNKSKGSYWKKKLLNNNLVTAKRTFTKVRQMEYQEYVEFKKGSKYLNLNFINGFLVIEGIASFSALNMVGEKAPRVLVGIKNII